MRSRWIRRALAFSRAPFLTAPRSITADSSLSREGVDMEGLLALLLVLMIPGLLTLLPSSSKRR